MSPWEARTIQRIRTSGRISWRRRITQAWLDRLDSTDSTIGRLLTTVFAPFGYLTALVMASGGAMTAAHGHPLIGLLCVGYAAFCAATALVAAEAGVRFKVQQCVAEAPEEDLALLMKGQEADGCVEGSMLANLREAYAPGSTGGFSPSLVGWTSMLMYFAQGLLWALLALMPGMDAALKDLGAMEPVLRTVFSVSLVVSCAGVFIVQHGLRKIPQE